MPGNPMEEWRQRIAPKIAAFRGQTLEETKQPGFEAPLFTNADLPPWDTSPPMTEEERRLKRLPYAARQLIRWTQAMQELMPAEAPSRNWAAELDLERQRLEATQELARRKQSSQEQSNLVNMLTGLLGALSRTQKPTEDQQKMMGELYGALSAITYQELAKRGIRPRQTVETSGLLMNLLRSLAEPERVPWEVGP